MDGLTDAIKNKKPFSKEEIYALLLARFRDSISNICDDLIEIIERNDLYANRKSILFDIRGIIENSVYAGRDFIYGINFNRTILNAVFEHTDSAIDEAEKAIIQAFQAFYDIGVENIQPSDYTLLKRRIRGIAKEMKNTSNRMLRQVILGVQN